MSDQLLTVLSRRGQVAWPTCRRYIQELTSRIGGEDSRPRYFDTITIKRLQALGYATVDFSDGAGMVWVAPRFLARLPSGGRPRAILVGHRTTDTEQALCNACADVPGAVFTVADDDKIWTFTPRRLAVEVNSEEDLATIANAIEAKFDPEPAAWRVLQLASTLDDYRSSLQWRRQKDVNWARRCFDPQAVTWGEGQVDSDGLSEFTDPVTQRRYYRLRRKDLIADAERYWGCYMALSACNRDVILFDGSGSAVLVPVGARLPSPFEAGMSLCSGYAPRLVSLEPEPGGPTEFLRYRDVPRVLADLATAKLRQRLLPSRPYRRHFHDSDGPARGIRATSR
jgi:hypothetical protein